MAHVSGFFRVWLVSAIFFLTNPLFLSLLQLDHHLHFAAESSGSTRTQDRVDSNPPFELLLKIHFLAKYYASKKKRRQKKRKSKKKIKRRVISFFFSYPSSLFSGLRNMDSVLWSGAWPFLLFAEKCIFIELEKKNETSFGTFSSTKRNDLLSFPHNFPLREFTRRHSTILLLFFFFCLFLHRIDWRFLFCVFERCLCLLLLPFLFLWFPFCWLR